MINPEIEEVEIETIPDKKPIQNPERELVPDIWPDDVPLPEPKA